MAIEPKSEGVGIICPIFESLFLYLFPQNPDKEQTRTFEPTNDSADCWSATHSYNFIIRVK